MKPHRLAACLPFALQVFAACCAGESLSPLPLGAVTAEGWMRTLLERSRDGMGGNFASFDPDQFEKPYTTHDYDAALPGAPRIGAKELPGWCAEMTGEHQLGRLELAVALGDAALLKKSTDWFAAALALQSGTDDGYLGAYRPQDDKSQDFNAWGAHYVYRAMLLEYSRTGDGKLLDAVHKGLLWFCRNWSGDRKSRYVGPTIIWPMVEVYRLTGDRALLDFCEDYADYLNRTAVWDFEGRRDETGSFDRFSLKEGGYHVVAYAVRAQLPGILSLANGNAALRQASVAAYDSHRAQVGWQATQAPRTKMEHTSPPNCVGETEYCNFLSWMEYQQWLMRLTGEARFGDDLERMVFNAAMGARRKDERAIAYDTSPNQFNATKTSCTEGWLKYYGAYTPCLFASCCTAQSIRLVPSYLAKAVLRTPDDDLAVTGYGPYRVEAGGLEIVSETLYPFEHEIRYRVTSATPWKGALRFRRPAWAEGAALVRNGAPAAVETRDGWIVVKGPWQDDRLVLSFTAAPRLVRVPDENLGEPLRAFEYGPLVFAQPLDTEWRTVEPEPTIRPLPAGGTWYEARVRTPPAIYAVPDGCSAADIRVARGKGGAYPWDDSPLRLAVPLVRATSAYPANPGRDGGNPAPRANPVARDAGAAVERVDLVPVGATNLRITCFPVEDGRKGGSR